MTTKIETLKEEIKGWLSNADDVTIAVHNREAFAKNAVKSIGEAVNEFLVNDAAYSTLAMYQTDFIREIALSKGADDARIILLWKACKL